MFGNPSLAAWGTSEWGSPLVDPGALFQLDDVVAGDLEVLFALDSSGGLVNAELLVLLDALVSGELETQFALDYAPVSLPLSVYGSDEIAPYILVELELPGGTVRASGHCVTALGKTWDPRLINAGEVLRTIGAGTDDLQMALDDTSFDGQTRFRDIFAAADPEGSLVNVWLGAEGAADSEHLLLFEGKLEQVVSFSYTEVRLRVLRREAVEDRLLGELVNETAFPAAPPDSISRMLPIVFGAVEAHEGIVVDTLGLATLAVNVFGTDTVLTLVDTIQLPAAGVVEINGEKISYSSKTATELFGLIRGFSATIVAEHAKGDEVREVGAFVVKFASHVLAAITNVRLLLPSGNLGEPVPSPSAIATGPATVTWTEIPKIRDPEATPVYQRVHFKDVGPGNLAKDPQFAARENEGYEAFKVAIATPAADLVLLANAADLGQPGDIIRVWLGVIFDPKGSAKTVIPNTVARIGSTSKVLFRLQPTDVVPEPIARNDEKTGDRFYEIPPPIADVTVPPEQGFQCTPVDVVHPGIWSFIPNAKNVVDGDEETCATYLFISIGEAAVIGAPDAIFKLAQDTSVVGKIVPGSTIKSAQLVFVAGWERTPFSSHFDVWLRKDGKEIPGTRFKACTAGTGGVACLGLIRGKERFVHPITAAIAAQIDDSVEWVVHPAFGVSNGLWVGCELFVEGLFQPPPPVVAIEQDARNTVTNYFEVTDKLQVQASPGGAIVRDWSFFTDLAQGGQVTFAASGAPLEEARFIETFYVVEYRPFVDTGTQIPRTFADVIGIEPGGNPADVFKRLVTLLPPLGLGLPVDRYDQAAYQTARTSYLVDGVRTDFAINDQVSVLRLMEELAGQVDSRQTWENKQHRILRLPRADTALPVLLTLDDDDLLSGNPIQIKRSPRASVINKATLKWKPYAPNDGATSKTDVVEDLVSQGKFGVQEQVFELSLIADDATATLVGTRKLERVSIPRWVVEFEMPLHGLNQRLGDLVAMLHRDFAFEVGEVTQLNLVAAGEKKVRVQIAVWKK